MPTDIRDVSRLDLGVGLERPNIVDLAHSGPHSPAPIVTNSSAMFFLGLAKIEERPRKGR